MSHICIYKIGAQLWKQTWWKNSFTWICDLLSENLLVPWKSLQWEIYSGESVAREARSLTSVGNSVCWDNIRATTRLFFNGYSRRSEPRLNFDDVAMLVVKACPRHLYCFFMWLPIGGWAGTLVVTVTLPSLVISFSKHFDPCSFLA
jgi:hypothetical protein